MNRIGVRTLNVLQEFKPFGLKVEASDNGEDSYSAPNDYQYSLFDSQLLSSSIEYDSLPPQDAEHELFFRGNHLIWSTGSQVMKRLTTSSPIIQACWCHMEYTMEPLLCVLHVGSLTIYTPSGDILSIAVSSSTSSIWPVPYGLLLQKAVDKSGFPTEDFSFSPLRTSDFGDIGHESSTMSPSQQYLPFVSSPNFSHYIVMHTLEKAQALFIKDYSKILPMNDPEEQILWTSPSDPYVVSHNKGTMKHSIWHLRLVNTKEERNFSISALKKDNAGEHVNVCCMSLLWQDKSAQPNANQVFMVSDEEGMQLFCFVFEGKQCLISSRIPFKEKNDEMISEIIDNSWTVPAITASAVIATPRRSKIHGRRQFDLLVMALDNNLYLYVGRHCLCKYVLPSSFTKALATTDASRNHSSGEKTLEIVGLSNAVNSRVNIVLSSGKVFRCSLRPGPISTITEDCIQALAEGLSPFFFQHFLKSLWSYDIKPNWDVDFHVDVEWETFSSLIKRWLSSLNAVYCPKEDAKKNTAWEFLLCSKMHKDYLQSPVCHGLFLPPSSGSYAKSMQSQTKIVSDSAKEELFLKQILTEMLDILHAMYENYKLDILHKRDAERLAFMLSNIAACIGEVNYVDHYARDFPGHLPMFPILHAKGSARNPPNLLQWLYNCLKHGCSLKDREGLPPLLCNEKVVSVDWSRKVVAFYGLLLGCQRNGSHLVLGVSFKVAPGTAHSPEHWTVLSMAAEGFGSQQLDRLPCGVSLPLRHALNRCRESLPADWPPSAYVLVGREDLALTAIGCSISPKSAKKVESVLNQLNLLHLSSPYALHLRPLDIPSSTSDLHDMSLTGSESVASTKDSVIDGMEHIFGGSMQLRFGRDLRLVEVRRLLCSATPVAIHSASGPVDEDQQGQLWHLTQRTTALAFGRGAFTISTMSTLLTEAMTIPTLDVSGRVPSMNNLIVHLNVTTGTISDVICWPEFHNGVAAGLKLAPHQARMSRTWIQYNAPEEPSFSHAGFLMALGLQGHLQALTRSDIYEYLTQSHEATMIGTMLGLAASHRGTMHPMISKMLYVHIPSRHPPTFPELDLSTHVQSAAIMAVGLLYQETTHPMTTRILLDEIGRRSGNGNVLERERYAIAAGFAFGLVTLGRGNDVLRSAEPTVNQLFQYLSGGMDLPNESYYIDYGLDPSGGNQGMDGLTLNIDVTAPAATIALTLMFLKTECELVARRLSVPDTHNGLQLVRPDFVLLRVVACSLILWNRILPTEAWVQSQIPDLIKKHVMNPSNSLNGESENVDKQVLFQSFANIIAGVCFSIGLKFAGTENADAQELLYSYAIYFLNEIKPVSSGGCTRYPKGLSRYVDRATLETCLSVAILSLSLVLAGTGHLQTFRLIRYLHSRIDANGHVKYGNHMAVSMAIGFLFLGGGMCTFATNKSAIAALLIALFPVFPTKSCDNNTHLQAFRHLYVLAVEKRCVQAVDVDTGCEVYVPLEITIDGTSSHLETSYCRLTPCLLPERSLLKRIRICGPRYWTQDIELSPSDMPWWGPKDKDDPFIGGVIYVKRKVGVCSYNDDPTGCQSLLSRAMNKASDGHKDKSCINIKCRSSRLSKIDQLVSAFSADPSLLAFAHLCCNQSWNYGSSNEFQEFCVQVLLQCVSTDRPAVLQMYLHLYTTISSLAECCLSPHTIWSDTLTVSSLKVAMGYLDALADGKLERTGEENLQTSFLAALGKRVEDIHRHWLQKRKDGSGRYIDFVEYLRDGTLAVPEISQNKLLPRFFLAFYLKWYSVPPSAIVNSSVGKLIASFPASFRSSKNNPRLPLLALMLPETHISALACIDESYVDDPKIPSLANSLVV